MLLGGVSRQFQFVCDHFALHRLGGEQGNHHVCSGNVLFDFARPFDSDGGMLVQ
jgi:hypothetical protein